MRSLLLFLAVLAGCGQDAAPAAAPLPEEDGSPAHTDGLPAAETSSPDGRFRAQVSRGGALVLHGPEGERTLSEGGVLHVVAFSPDSSRLVYAQQDAFPDSDLQLVDLTDGSRPSVLLEWPGPEDRPLFSPDGTQVAFVSGRSGWASVYLTDLQGTAPMQLTNVGIEDLPRKPGEAPEGFVPPPESNFTWTAAGLSWEARGQTWTVDATELTP